MLPHAPTILCVRFFFKTLFSNFLYLYLVGGMMGGYGMGMGMMGGGYGMSMGMMGMGYG